MRRLWTMAAVMVAVSFLGVGFLQAADAPKKREHKRPSPEQIIKKLDTDGNGTLSLDEFSKSRRFKDNAERAKKVFTRMDTNKDSQVCAKELAEAFKRHREHHKGGHKKDEAKGKKKGTGPICRQRPEGCFAQISPVPFFLRPFPCGADGARGTWPGEPPGASFPGRRQRRPSIGSRP